MVNKNMTEKQKSKGKKKSGRHVKHGLFTLLVSRDMDKRKKEYKAYEALRKEMIKGLGRKPTIFDEIRILTIVNQTMRSCRHTINDLKNIPQGSHDYIISNENSLRLNVDALQGDPPKESPNLEKYLKGLRGKGEGVPR